jgi:o-succinylbenzoate synthase
MRISSLRCQPYVLPFTKPFRTSHGTLRERRGWVVWVADEEGRWGVGEAAPLKGFGMETHEAAGRVLRGWSETLPGREVDVRPPSAGDVPAAFGLAGDAPDAPAARHGLELALLDLAARRAARPLAAYLHPSADGEVAVNAVLGAASPEETVREAAALVAEGYGTLKLKVGADTAGEDQERLRAVRCAVGSAVCLRIDGNASWSKKAALPLLERLAPLDIEYAEQPLPADDIKGMAELARLSPIPLAADESVLSLENARSVLGENAAQVLVLKPMALGGILTTLAVARLAEQHGVRVVITTMLDGAFARMGAACAAAALGGVLAGGGAGVAHGLATGGLLAEDLVPAPPLPHAGRLTLPTGAGLGMPAAPPSPH